MEIQYAYDNYIKGKPAEADMTRAIYAFGFNQTDIYAPHKFYREYPKNADIDSLCRTDTCIRCGRSRLQIRWDDENPECSQFIKYDIAETLHSEEDKYFALLAKYEVELPDIIRNKYKGVVDGTVLFELQSNLGIEPDIVSALLDIEIEKLLPEFERNMDLHRAKSKNIKFR